jgi:hemerythrin-like domain-containing protein
MERAPPPGAGKADLVEERGIVDPVQMLMSDHQKVKGLFQQYEQAQDGREKRRIAETVFKELEVHSKLEEEIFYPAVRKAGGSEEKELVAESIEEHHVVDVLIKELKGMSTTDERYDAKFTVLMENVKHHIQEEETEMLPDARSKLGDEAQQLAQKMEQRKQELMAAAR